MENIQFFKGKELDFVQWLVPMLKVLEFEANQYIYSEGDQTRYIYFLNKGLAGFVLPRYKNSIYILIEKGDHFGIIDLVPVREIKGKLVVSSEKKLKRSFTVQALEKTELLALRIEDLNKIQVEFADVFQELFLGAFYRLKRAIKQKKKVVKIAEE